MICILKKVTISIAIFPANPEHFTVIPTSAICNKCFGECSMVSFDADTSQNCSDTYNVVEAVYTPPGGAI